MKALVEGEKEHFYDFGPFRVDPKKRLLLRDGTPQPLTPKALDILLVLLRHGGQVIEKDELMRAVWPDTVVEENNLTRNISALRKALGEGPQDHSYVVTVPGCGYSFVASVRKVMRDEGTELIWEKRRARVATEEEESDSTVVTATLAQKTTESYPNNLPSQLTSLIGRNEELAEIERLLRQTHLRLLTLTGSGGTGKTRLALEVAAGLLRHFAHGVFFVDLAPVSDPVLVVSAIAQTLGITEASENLVGALKRHLRDKEVLLLLDNFEQLLTAAPLVTELLATCHQLKVLVTSRALLHLHGEYEFPVQPLGVPDTASSQSVEALLEYASIVLFTQRARAVKPDLEIKIETAQIVAEICTRLDGLPLAIELAAAQVKVLPPRAMLARLDNRLKLLIGGACDLPARQQTMRSTIAWSYDLLDEPEKKLFRRLAVFVGGFTLEAAEVVCNIAAENRIDILQSVAALTNKSLLRQTEQPDGEPRFMILETIREYAFEQLEASEETSTVRRQHANFFLELIERVEPELSGANQGIWLDRLETEHGNLRAALLWARENEEVEVGSRIAGALGRFWLMHSYLSEGRERLAEFLALTGPDARPETRAKLLTSAATLAQNQGDYTAARSLFDESLAIWQEIGNKERIAASLTSLGWIAWRQSDYPAARALSQEGLVLNRKLGNKQGIAHSLNNLGFVAHHEGDYATARCFHEESLSLRRELGDKRGIAFAQANLGWAIHKLGDYEQAANLLEEARALFKHLGDKQLFAFSSNILADVVQDQGHDRQAKTLLEESVQTCREIGAKYSLAVGLRILGNVTNQQGEHQRAAALVSESLNIFREIGDRYGAALALCSLANITLDQGDNRSAESLLRESLILRNEIGDKHGIVECLTSLAGVAVAQAKMERASQIIGASDTLRASLEIKLSPTEQERYERNKELSRSGLSDRLVASSYKNGSAMTLERAVAFALA
ncbi:MAG TPA: tetratricopeptide repeat protein [Pyrinomonadaceae bacterium]|nr:tetratricopeptide repeat protein [Pyrinomonadaceae bacterium]